jgi:hypothetical protein
MESLAIASNSSAPDQRSSCRSQSTKTDESTQSPDQTPEEGSPADNAEKEERTVMTDSGSVITLREKTESEGFPAK